MGRIIKTEGNIRFSGPFLDKPSGRQRIYIYEKGTKTKVINYARYLMEEHLGRKLLREEFVDHINGDKTNDSIDNLQILSNSDNIIKAHKEGTCTVEQLVVYARSEKGRKESSGRLKGNRHTAKLTNNQVIDFRNKFKDRLMTMKEIAVLCGIDYSAIVKMIKGKSYQNVCYPN